MEKSKYVKLLEEVAKSLPREREYLNAHSLIKRTLSEVLSADTKKQKRLRNAQATLTPHEQWKMDLETSTLYNPQQKMLIDGAVKTLDQLIQKEKDKLEQIRKKNSIEKVEPDENVDTIFG